MHSMSYTCMYISDGSLEPSVTWDLLFCVVYFANVFLFKVMKCENTHFFTNNPCNIPSCVALIFCFCNYGRMFISIQTVLLLWRTWHHMFTGWVVMRHRGLLAFLICFHASMLLSFPSFFYHFCLHFIAFCFCEILLIFKGKLLSFVQFNLSYIYLIDMRSVILHIGIPI